MLALAIATLVAMLAAASWTVLVRRPGPAAVLLLLSLCWLFTNAAIEGPVLWTLDPEHGLVLADLLTPVGVLLALWRFWTLGAGRRRSRGNDVVATAATGEMMQQPNRTR